MKAGSSQVIAVVKIVDGAPLCVSVRNRPHSRICAFHAVSRTDLDAPGRPLPAFPCWPPGVPVSVLSISLRWRTSVSVFVYSSSWNVGLKSLC